MVSPSLVAMRDTLTSKLIDIIPSLASEGSVAWGFFYFFVLSLIDPDPESDALLCSHRGPCSGIESQSLFPDSKFCSVPPPSLFAVPPLSFASFHETSDVIPR